eukprot:TRINITY_DN37477_c0_g1_i1.p1 TRINITY_DN37477_c0_g1~~TRINITY_DN37477_c0_g1_i1.p1  ORF type:complete len:377 (-),score=31.89 TRINITY_DN37477_c0_g1_i1:7-1137(-)
MCHNTRVFGHPHRPTYPLYPPCLRSSSNDESGGSLYGRIHDSGSTQWRQSENLYVQPPGTLAPESTDLPRQTPPPAASDNPTQAQASQVPMPSQPLSDDSSLQPGQQINAYGDQIPNSPSDVDWKARCGRGPYLHFKARRGSKVTDQYLLARETAIVVVDVWKQHWCPEWSRTATELAKRISATCDCAREAGVTITWTPTHGGQRYHAEHPLFKKIDQAPESGDRDYFRTNGFPKNGFPTLPQGMHELNVKCPSKKQANIPGLSPVLHIDNRDGINVEPRKVNNWWKSKGIKNIVVMGVHANACLLSKMGTRYWHLMKYNVYIVRDLVEPTYNQAQQGRFPHSKDFQTAIDTIVRYHEKHYAASISSSELIGVNKP